MKKYERAILISPLGSNSSWLQGLILIFLELQRAAESCIELHGAAWWAAGSCCSWLVGKFRGGYHRQPGLPRFGVCQDVSSNSKIFRASDSPSLSRLCQASKPRHCRKWALLRGVTISFALTECSLWATLCTSMFRPIAEQWPRKIVASQSWIWKGPTFREVLGLWHLTGTCSRFGAFKL